MTVLDPALEVCPECGSTQLYGDMRTHTNVGLDGEGGISFIEQHDESTAFESLRCSECDHSLIENGIIVDDAVSGDEVGLHDLRIVAQCIQDGRWGVTTKDSALDGAHQRLSEMGVIDE